MGRFLHSGMAVAIDQRCILLDLMLDISAEVCDVQSISYSGSKFTWVNERRNGQ